ncbi:MAG TPA: hypothetical protein VHV55_05685 [Pirellulales bacterium]|nr:hypothetical protein [Pirellulales bacterium]
MDLELATTEQILDELAKRPLKFVFVSMFPYGQDRLSGYLAHSPNMKSDDALLMLHKAEELFADEPIDEQSLDDEAF